MRNAVSVLGRIGMGWGVAWWEVVVHDGVIPGWRGECRDG